MKYMKAIRDLKSKEAWDVTSRPMGQTSCTGKGREGILSMAESLQCQVSPPCDSCDAVCGEGLPLSCTSRWQDCTVQSSWFDPQGQKAILADKLAKHMNYQLLEDMEDWEEEMDRLLIMLPIVGCLFKKTYFDPIKKKN
jgi:hypothetical protein